MTYSCTDFNEDILGKLVSAGLIKADDVPGDDPEGQSHLAMGAIDTLLERVEALTNLIRTASVLGGIGEHEFSRPGGWREQALNAISPDTPMLRLFFVSADDGNGENADLLTRATDAEAAVGQWRSYFTDGDIPVKPKWIGIVPITGVAGPIPWNDIRTLRDATNVPRYITGNWSHIFADSSTERDLRLVFDTVTKRVIAMQIRTGIGYECASQEAIADVQDSLLTANEDALETPDNWGLERTYELPDWSAPGTSAS